MSKKRRTAEKSAIVPPGKVAVAVATDEPQPPKRSRRWWIYALVAVAFLLAAFEVYGPAMNGPFLFDDYYLPFLTDTRDLPLRYWVGVVRPLLMISYWANYRLSGWEPYSYHVVNVILHAGAALLIWLILRRLLAWTGQQGRLREVLSAAAAALFLLHPVQTESVAYIAGRSETQSVFFFLAAYALFVYQPPAGVSLARAAGILVLFAAALLSKEHAVVLPGLLLLTDFLIFTPNRFEGIKRNLRLYIPIAAGAALGVAFVLRLLASAQSAGFNLQEFTWYQYLFTQFRVLWTYLRLYVLPVGLNGDYEYAVSRTIFDGGAIVRLLGLLALAVLAWRWRSAFPLAALGYFAFLLLLAPTSSVLPIRDVIAERRMYLPFIGLLLITVDLLRRVRLQPGALAAGAFVVLAIAGVATYQRAKVWGNPELFWQDTVAKSPGNARARFQLAYVQWQAGRCGESVANYQKVSGMQKPESRLYIDWALALECAGKPDEAVTKLQQAVKLSNTAHVHAQIGMVYGKNGRHAEALAALDEAEKLDPSFDMTYVYRGNVFAARGDYNTAAALYRKALSLAPDNASARAGLQLAERQLRTPAAR